MMVGIISLVLTAGGCIRWLQVELVLCTGSKLMKIPSSSIRFPICLLPSLPALPAFLCHTSGIYVAMAHLLSPQIKLVLSYLVHTKRNTYMHLTRFEGKRIRSDQITRAVYVHTPVS
jgi:hypothetical protein